MKTFLTTVAAATLIASGAQALSVNEVTDFGNGATDAATTNVGTLDVGSNRITGAVAGSCDGGFCFSPNSDVDDFIFTVGTGTQITGFGVDNEKDGSATDVIFEVFLRTSTGAINTLLLSLGQGEHDENSSEDFTADLAVPLAAGDYFVSYFAYAGGDGDYEGYWGVNVDVEAVSVVGPQPNVVPLPATLPLLLAGFGALGIARRKRG